MTTEAKFLTTWVFFCLMFVGCKETVYPPYKYNLGDIVTIKCSNQDGIIIYRNKGTIPSYGVKTHTHYQGYETSMFHEFELEPANTYTIVTKDNKTTKIEKEQQ